MPSPTIATTLTPSRSEAEFTRDRENSSSKAASTALSAFWPWAVGTAHVMDASEDACVTIRTATPASLRAPRTRRPSPAAESASSAPSSVNNDASSTEVMPLISDSRAAPLLMAPVQSRDSVSAPLRPWMTVPSKAGLKTFRTKTGMLSSMHGAIALGCSTCAPK